MSYDGSLITTVTRTGSVEDTMALSYNADLIPDAFSYAGDIQGYGYDADGLLTLAAPFTIDRRADNGIATTVTASGFSLVRDWSEYGEIDAADYGAYRYSVARGLAGRVVELTETAGAETHVRTFEYDSLGRLARITRDGDLAESYDYDVQGNRTGYRAPVRGIDTTLATTFHPDDGLAASADTTYTYTADGYIASAASAEGTTTYAYTGLGELERVTLPTGREVSYRYDAAGRRVARLVDGEIVERYLWADTTHLLATYDATGTVTRRFTYADARVPYAVDTPAGRHFLAYDQVGSLKAVTDAGGIVVERHDYDSFGVPIEGSTPSTITGLGFAGGLTDPDTGLVLFGARDYDPKTGRWMAKDPIGFAGGDVNLYGYCLGDPVNLVDPSGRRGYVNINPASPVLGPIGFSAGILIDPNSGIYPYLGPAVLTSPGVSVFGSAADVVPGWYAAGQGGAVLGGSVGAYLGPCASDILVDAPDWPGTFSEFMYNRSDVFWEAGGTLPGAGVELVYVWPAIGGGW